MKFKNKTKYFFFLNNNSFICMILQELIKKKLHKLIKNHSFLLIVVSRLKYILFLFCLLKSYLKKYNYFSLFILSQTLHLITF